MVDLKNTMLLIYAIGALWIFVMCLVFFLKKDFKIQFAIVALFVASACWPVLVYIAVLEFIDSIGEG